MLLFRTCTYFFSRGIKNIWRNRLTSFSTVGIIAAGLSIFGIFLLLSMNINSLLTNIENQCEINVYISDNAGGATLNQIESELKKIDGVEDVRFFSKEDRLQRAKETTYKDKEYILEDLEEDNPLRDSYILIVEDIGMSAQISEKAASVNGVDEVNNLQELADKIKQFASTVRRIGGILMIMLAIIAIFIISNTIRLCIVSRSDEVSIMRFVGASNRYISGPFLVEGIILGLLGAVVAFAIVSLGYANIVNKINDIFFGNISGILAYKEIWRTLIGSLAFIGIGIGFIGCEISLRKYLRV